MRHSWSKGIREWERGDKERKKAYKERFVELRPDDLHANWRGDPIELA